MRLPAVLMLVALSAACSDPSAPTPPAEDGAVSDDIARDAPNDGALDAPLDAQGDVDVTVVADAADALDASSDTANDVAADVLGDAADGADAGVRCMGDTCGPHGRCEVTDAALTCACEPGYRGMRCDQCGTGYVSDGHGGCTNTPCDPNPCAEPDRTRCTSGPTGAVCSCNPGTHEDSRGQCVADVTCTPTTCNGHGTCSADASGLRCTCASEYAGARCDACAADAHPDGAGGCTRDACVPSPCAEPRRSVCVAVMGVARCDCDTGYHLEVDRCVVDEVCTPSRCAMHGTCAVSLGRASCTCAGGYTGAMCDACAVGYHGDGMGGCTNDPCVPSPCTVAHRTVCSAMGTTAVCGCDAGYHPDGAGGCTNDPCVPDPCAARNMACRATMGAAGCYTPMCNDGNPCTDDALVSGRCVSTPRADGSACTTSACTTGQRCMAATCTGGTPLRCDDGNPCTRDACNPTSGCAATNDDALVPDDGVACTVDRCAAGRATHTATDALCDDTRYCTGVERCVPGDAGADARGCVTSMVPAAPGMSTACATYTCDDATRSFVLTTRTGMTCDDTVACTTSDACTAAGLCIGRLVAGCTGAPASTCASTTPFGATVNLPTARVTGTVTLDGAALPRTLTPAQVPSFASSALYLVARDTGVRHLVAQPSYTYGTSSYGLTTNTDRVDANIPPGVYDLALAHNVGSSGAVGRYPTDPYPSASRVIRSDIVIGLGPNTLDINLVTARVTGTMTLDGAALPRTLTPAQVPSFASSSVYLVARDTHVRHLIAQPSYTYGTSSYGLTTSTDRVDANIPPGVYDLLLAHNVGSSGAVGRYPTDPYPSSERVLRTDIVVNAGANTLDVNLVTATVTGAVTLDGAALPRTLTPAQVPSFASSAIYLVARDTGTRHLVAQPSYTYGTSSYGLTTSTDRVDARIPPGTYDLLLSHNVGSSGAVGRYPTDPYPSADRVLRTGVVVNAGANTLDVNLVTGRLTGAVTLDGAALPRTLTPAQVPSFASSAVYLVSRDTHVRHLIAQPSYTYGTSSYGLTTSTDRVDANIPPGTYDLLLAHNVGSSGAVGRYPTDPYPSAERVLRTDIVVNAGANTLDVNLVTATVSGAVTLDGVALPRTLTPAQVPSFASSALYLVARDTGTRHLIAQPSYTYGTSSYGLTTSTDRVDARIPPGTYDLELVHNIGSSGSAGRYPADPYPSGDRILRTGVTLTAGANTLDVNIPTTRVTGGVTLDGVALPRTLTPAQVPSFASSSVYLVSRDTHVRHLVAQPSYTYGTSSYGLTTSTDRVDANIPPGTYDMELVHNVGSSGDVGRYPTDPYPSADRVLRACVTVP